MPPSIDNVVAVETGEEEEMITEETHNGQMNGDADTLSVDRSSSDVKMKVTLNGVSNGGYLYRNQAPNMGKFVI